MRRRAQWPARRETGPDVVTPFIRILPGWEGRLPPPPRPFGGEDCERFQFDVPAELAGAMANPVRTVVTLRERACVTYWIELSSDQQAITLAITPE